MLKIKNKKGIAPLIIVAIIVGGLLLGVLGGWFTAHKINSFISSVPSWVWWLSIFIIILILLPKKK